MSRQRSGPDAARTRLRTTVATMDREIARLTKESTDSEGKSPLSGLVAPWADLVAQLALGSEPEVRECPVCGAIGMRYATLCGSCWTKLEPPAHDSGSESTP
jgi:hypothetical protein